MKNQYSKYDDQETTNLKLVIGLYRSYNSLNRQTQNLLNNYDLTVSQFGVLEALYHLGDMKINGIIEKTLSTSGNITVVIKNLEKNQLIERYKDPIDSRICMIRLTEEGHNLIEAVFAKHLQVLKDAMKNLNSEEKTELLNLLKKLNGANNERNGDSI